MTPAELTARGVRVKHFRQQLRWWQERPLMAEPIKSQAIRKLHELIAALTTGETP